ncbi:hypothetical protein HNQ71_006439 [Mesorhizobium sangaii]|uniref:Uncharacterized protein n=1 Tax=Mesorhizobium sangaii TaxID=505389 RepID=A0A841PT44_9HYPH|nr:hypothetical protein [Mesorhizobium sangaii]
MNEIVPSTRVLSSSLIEFDRSYFIHLIMRLSRALARAFGSCDHPVAAPAERFVAEAGALRLLAGRAPFGHLRDLVRNVQGSGGLRDRPQCE